MFKKTIAVIIVFAVVAAGTFFLLTKSSTSPDAVFKKHLQKFAASQAYAYEETDSGAGTKIAVKGKIDLPQKNLIQLAAVSCTTQASSGDISVDISLQQEAATSYFRIDTASGSATDARGKSVELGTALSKNIGQWYKFDSNSGDVAIKAQLDSGVLVSSDGIMAPGSNSNKVVQSLLDNKVFTIKSSTKNGDTYSLQIDVSRSAYAQALKDALPNLSDQDLVLNSIFEGKDSISITLALSKDGTLISEKLDLANPCPSLLSVLAGTSASDLPEWISGIATPKTPELINIDTIPSSKPVSEYTNALVQ